MMDWNDETIARLRCLWDEGHTTAEIGRRLGITKNAVVGKAHRLILPARPSPIRRDVQTRPARETATRRASGPTLSNLAAVAEERVIEAVRPQPLLRPVASTLRASGRVTSCCWPIGDPGTPSFRFCDDVAAIGKPYCGTHAALAYVKLRDRREDAA